MVGVFGPTELVRNRASGLDGFEEGGLLVLGLRRAGVFAGSWTEYEIPRLGGGSILAGLFG